jgi:flagellar basal body-associated protein FliL
MSDDKSKAAAPVAGGGPNILGMILPAVLAAAAAFGGAKLAAGHHTGAPVAEAKAAEAVKPPGPTLALDAFVVTIPDNNKKVHPMKVTIAVEFEAKAKEEELKGLTPRIRDATLGYLRTLSYDEAIDPSVSDKIRSEILERLKGAGTGAERILITDLVVQ